MWALVKTKIDEGNSVTHASLLGRRSSGFKSQRKKKSGRFLRFPAIFRFSHVHYDKNNPSKLGNVGLAVGGSKLNAGEDSAPHHILLHHMASRHPESFFRSIGEPREPCESHIPGLDRTRSPPARSVLRLPVLTRSMSTKLGSASSASKKGYEVLRI